MLAALRAGLGLRRWPAGDQWDLPSARAVATKLVRGRAPAGSICSSTRQLLIFSDVAVNYAWIVKAVPDKLP